ncbi:phosphate acetyltransferase [Candidatus Sulfidibacterium hydrothermale]|uniref:phosphate acetyltransferase n=1 Tax=Candidatus Sulfidibacterium hydrothermale TaxID=2875962 RepID=UPI001F0B071F|nr:phosphate acetyltransferase [Candidatus Sulfidibacterium hydrothermale]UBM61839.1 phosphate acetyltransferase [Candidatus Sulfidibacterium hydrothermale]
MELIDKIHEMARQAGKTIVLPEGTEERNLRAADYVLKEKIAAIILLGNRDEILKKASGFSLQNIEKATIIDPKNHPDKTYYARMLADIRKKKGMTYEEALKKVEEPLYLSTLLIKDGKADGEVSGAEHATGDVLRPAFQIIKTLPGVSAVSGAFIMILKDKNFGTDGVMIFADCAVNPDPSVRELAEIAVESAKTAKNIAGIEPKVAMLSFSTKGSAKHEKVDKVVEALNMAKTMNPDLQIDGELQADAAIIEAIGKKKAPGSPIAGKANVLVFPSLESGNIAYKLVQRLAGAEAVGPVLQGLAAPINDLSRGCSVDDIINMIAITANQANGLLQ